MCGEYGILREHGGGGCYYGKICKKCNDAIEVETRPKREEEDRKIRKKRNESQQKWRKKRNGILKYYA